MYYVQNGTFDFSPQSSFPPVFLISVNCGTIDTYKYTKARNLNVILGIYFALTLHQHILLNPFEMIYLIPSLLFIFTVTHF